MSPRSKQIGAEAKKRRPTDSACGVEEKEAPPRHVVGAGQQGGERPEYRDEAAEEDHGGPITREQILTKPETLLVDVDVAAAAPQQGRPSRRPTQYPRLSPVIAPAAAASTTDAMEAAPAST